MNSDITTVISPESTMAWGVFPIVFFLVGAVVVIVGYYKLIRSGNDQHRAAADRNVHNRDKW